MEQILRYSNIINQIDTHDYFAHLHDMSLADFIKSFRHFVYAVDEWSRVLAKITAYVPTYNERRVLVANLYDENNGSVSHVETFENFVALVHSLVDSITHCEQSLNHTKQFVMSLRAIADSHDWIYAVSALGMIEYTYVTVSRYIREYVSQHTTQDIPHFTLHETIDVDHATQLFGLVAKYYTSHHNQIISGINTGYHMFDEFFTGIYNT